MKNYLPRANQTLFSVAAIDQKKNQPKIKDKDNKNSPH